jgi:hypothetical protein
MKIEIRWSETNHYRSVIEGPDEGELREWIAESGVPGAKIDGAMIKEWYEDGDEDEWFGRVDITRDYEGTQDRHVDEVSIVD